MENAVPLIVAFVLGLVLAGVVIALLTRRGQHNRDALGQTVDTLAQTQIALAGRLDQLTKTLGDGLEQSATKTAETLGELKTRLTVIDEAQKNIAKVGKELSGQVGGLQDILSNKQARGAFGEVQLGDLVENALPPAAYTFQATLSNNRRADCLIRLPNPPGPIVVDAKFPLESYRALREADDEAARTAAGRAFSQAILKHVDDIATRYIVPGETADWALMFLPSEAIYAELHAGFQNVVEKSRRKKVAIVSPDTLWATLTTIRAVLRDVQMHEQAGIIQAEVQAMAEDVGRLDERVGKLQRHFDQASEDMRNIRISTEKVTKRSESIEHIELGDDDAADDLEPPVIRLEAKEN